MNRQMEKLQKIRRQEVKKFFYSSELLFLFGAAYYPSRNSKQNAATSPAASHRSICRQLLPEPSRLSKQAAARP